MQLPNARQALGFAAFILLAWVWHMVHTIFGPTEGFRFWGFLPDVHTCLREGITLDHLRELAMALSDVQAAEELSEARAARHRRVGAKA